MIDQVSTGKDSVRAIDLKTAGWLDRSAARLQELSAYGKRLRLVEFAPGFADPTRCRKGHVVYILGGAIESEYEDGVSWREAGEAYIIPWGVKHRSRNPHARPARVLIVDDVRD